MDYEYVYTDESLENLSILVNSISFDLNTIQFSLPKYPFKHELSLYDLALNGLRNIFKKEPDINYLERLKYEIDIIESLNFADYFLFVQDYVLFAKNNDILVGPARGSSASSLVAFSLGITTIDPIVHNLYFERFLNIERKNSLPDIDVDFADDSISTIEEYLYVKYSKDNVARLITYNEYGIKQSINDVSKIFGLEQQYYGRLVKILGLDGIDKVDEYKSLSQREIFELLLNIPEVKKEIQSFSLFSRITNHCKKIIGLYRYGTSHPSGILIHDAKINLEIPTFAINSTHFTSILTMHDNEGLNIPKFDLLALHNLTLIKEIENNIDYYKLNLEDKKVYETLRKYPLGIFQLDSQGMNRTISQLKISCFTDLCASIALYRPATLDQIDLYVQNKENGIKYLHNDLKQILESTNGIIVYQEQILQILNVICGFSLAKSDIIRRAISKKNTLEILKIKDEMFLNMQNSGYDLDFTNSLYALIEKFCEYGFNKAHCVSYGTLCYTMGYLKTYKTLDFYTVLLNDIGKDVTTFRLLNMELKEQHIDLEKPNILYSSNKFEIVNNKIYAPFYLIQGIQSNFTINEKSNDIVSLIEKNNITENEIYNLINVGAFDCINPNRTALESFVTKYYRYIKINPGSNYFPKYIDIPNIENIQKQNELLNGYFFDYRFPYSLEKRQSLGYVLLNNIKSNFTSYVYINKITKRTAKKTNKEYYQIELVDETSSINGLFFSTLDKNIIEKNIYKVSGNKKDDTIFINKIVNV
jgi:DNA polymerase-3 subunit alpha